MRYFIVNGHYTSNGRMIYKTDDSNWYWHSPKNNQWIRISGIPYESELVYITEEEAFLELI